MTVLRSADGGQIVTVEGFGLKTREAGVPEGVPVVEWSLQFDGNDEYTATAVVKSVPAGATGLELAVAWEQGFRRSVGTELVAHNLGSVTGQINSRGVIRFVAAAVNANGAGRYVWTKIFVDGIYEEPTEPLENTAVPTLTGSPLVGGTLTAQGGTWVGAVNVAVSIERRDAVDAAQSDVTAPYVIPPGDVDFDYRVKAVGTDIDGGTVTAYSTPWIGPVTEPVTTPAPRLLAAAWTAEPRDLGDGTFTGELDMPAEVVALEWTNTLRQSAADLDGTGYEPCVLDTGTTWVMSSDAGTPHIKDYGEQFANFSVRHKVDLAADWSARAEDNKPIEYAGPISDGEYAWQVVPLTTAAQVAYGARATGEQHMLGFARSLSDPQHATGAQDVSMLWTTDNGGLTWIVPKMQGMGCSNLMSIEIDPLVPAVQLVIASASGQEDAKPYQGLYRTGDFWDTCSLVLPIPSGWNYQISRDRYVGHKIAVDPASFDTDQAETARVWYAILEQTPTATANSDFVRADGGIWKSINGGRSFGSMLSTIPASWGELGTLLVHPVSGDLYLCGEMGIRKSTTGGVSWAAWGSGLPAGRVESMQFSSGGDTVTVGVFKVGVYRATGVNSGGAAFTQLFADANFERAYVSPVDPDLIWAMIYNKLPKVRDGASAPWVQCTGSDNGYPKAYNAKIHVSAEMAGHPTERADVLATGGAYFHRTKAAVTAWQSSADGFAGDGSQRGRSSISFHPTNPEDMAFALNDKCLHSSRDTGLRAWDHYNVWWEKWDGPRPTVNTPIKEDLAGGLRVAVNCIRPPVAGVDRVVLDVGSYQAREIIYSDDGGVNFLKSSIFGTRMKKHFGGLAIPAAVDAMYLGAPDTAHVCYLGNYRSLDGGVTWAEMAQAHDGVHGVSSLDRNICFDVEIATGKVWKSTDRGVTFSEWVDFGGSFDKFYGDDAMWINDPTDDDVCWGIRTIGGIEDIYRYEGGTFYPTGFSAYLSGGHVGGMAIDPNDDQVIYATTSARGVPYLFRSTDRAATWEDITFNHPMLGRPRWPQVSPVNSDVWTGSGNGERVGPRPGAPHPDSMWPTIQAMWS